VNKYNFTPDFNLKSVLNTDTFDRESYGELRSKSRKLKEVEEAGSENYSAFPHLLGDTWAGLFKNKPKLTKDCPKGVEANQALMERVLKHPEFQALREYTRLNELASALGTAKLSNELSKIIEQNDEAQLQQEQAEQKQQEADKAQSANEALQEAAENAQDEKKKEQLEQQAQQKLQQMQEAQKQADQHSQQALQAMQEQLDSQNGQEALSQAIGRAEDGTVEEKKEVESLLASMGYGTGPGDKQKVPAKDKLALAEILQKKPKVKKIANLLGKMQKVAIKKQKSKTDDTVARTDVDLGRELSAILPSELAHLKNKVTRKQFMKKYASGELLQYSPKGKETLGKGPLVVCIDTSGSMRDKDDQSKAFMLSMLMIARKQNRAFACINYANRSQVKRWVFERSKKISPKEIVEMAELFHAGGTDFEAPLNHAKSIIETSGKFKKADILFVTDGSCAVNDTWTRDFNRYRTEKNINVISIQVGDDSTDTLKRFSDKIVNARDFFSKDVSDAAFTV